MPAAQLTRRACARQAGIELSHVLTLQLIYAESDELAEPAERPGGPRDTPRSWQRPLARSYTQPCTKTSLPAAHASCIVWRQRPPRRALTAELHTFSTPRFTFATIRSSTVASAPRLARSRISGPRNSNSALLGAVSAGSECAAMHPPHDVCPVTMTAVSLCRG